ncbi:MAG: MotA/TolQ/ExbB proton channel family protein [Opitutales bacterium]
MKRFIHACLPGFLTLLMCLPASAQSDAPAPPEPEPDPLLQLLEEVRTQRLRESEANRERIAEFERRRDRQRQLLEQARQELADAEAYSEQLKQTYNENERTLSELETRLQEELGDLGEIFGNVRQIAGEFRAIFGQSLVSAQIPGRRAFMARLAESKALPKIEDLERLWYEIQRETTEAGRTVRFEADVLDAQGISSRREVARVGIFNAVSDGRFLRYETDTQQLAELPRQPAQRYLDSADELLEAESGYVNMTVDPSQGVLLEAIAQSPDLQERVKQGKVVGYVILALLALGLLLCLERFVSLYLVNLKMSRQLKNPADLGNNPLGRIMWVFQKYNKPDADLETLELKLDEAIMKEVPVLERGLQTIKILAAIAPLLGLLGTVTGMIATFQSITLFGTGDPKLMAGGISQALVTTVLGLVASIPLVLLHSILQGKSDQAVQLLEEQSAGLIAEFAENRGTPTATAES